MSPLLHIILIFLSQNGPARVFTPMLTNSRTRLLLTHLLTDHHDAISVWNELETHTFRQKLNCVLPRKWVKGITCGRSLLSNIAQYAPPPAKFLEFVN